MLLELSNKTQLSPANLYGPGYDYSTYLLAVIKNLYFVFETLRLVVEVSNPVAALGHVLAVVHLLLIRPAIHRNLRFEVRGRQVHRA